MPPPPTDGGPPTDAIEAFCREGAAAFCDGNANCCPTPYSNRSVCEAEQYASCFNGVADALAMAGLTLDPGRFAAFLEYFRMTAERCGGPEPGPTTFPFAGTTPAGGDCSPGGSGDDLRFLTCLPGLVCNFSVTSGGVRGTCGDPAVAGGACSSPFACPLGYYCTARFDGPGSTTGICDTQLPDGSPCDRDDMCDGGQCDVAPGATRGRCALRPNQFCGDGSGGGGGAPPMPGP